MTTEAPTFLELNIKPLVGMTDAELHALVEVCLAKQDSFPMWCAWLYQILTDEQQRRQTPGSEPAMIRVPAFTGNDFADVLMGAYCFSRYPMPDGIANFVDDVTEHIMAAAAGAFQHFLPEVRL